MRMEAVLSNILLGGQSYSDMGSSSPISGSFDEHHGDAEHAEAIRHALKDIANSSGKNSHRSDAWMSSEDEEDAMEHDDEDSETERSLSFKEQRRAHYDEFLKIKELRRTGSLIEDESNEAEDLGMRKNRQSYSSSSQSVGVKDSGMDEGKTGSTSPPHTANGN
uniref:Uncharacterized protein n=1 Tax=Opuntia streptacantha TaxID=393608 RepID=A0A7C8ZEW9_OPUST